LASFLFGGLGGVGSFRTLVRADKNWLRFVRKRVAAKQIRACHLVFDVFCSFALFYKVRIGRHRALTVDRRAPHSVVMMPDGVIGRAEAEPFRLKRR
jgi:hypothetical protein